jgi:hypothetical protein
MAQCGYEATAADAMFSSPLQAIKVALRGPRTQGPMAPEIPLDRQRPAQYIFADQVQQRLSEIRAAETQEKARKSTASASTAA